ncbi:MAG TPA: GxxExxY protein [Longimicrobiales bacterium]|nr:GxxExxY protein [Longimicrobiales bacterium]
MRKAELDIISGQIVDAAVKIHLELGPGLLESVYEMVLMHDLTQRGYVVRRQVRVPAVIRNITFDPVFIADMIVADAGCD